MGICSYNIYLSLKVTLLLCPVAVNHLDSSIEIRTKHFLNMPKMLIATM